MWIWSLERLSLHTLLVHRAPVKGVCLLTSTSPLQHQLIAIWLTPLTPADMLWDPEGARLAICTGSRWLFLWRQDLASTCRSPTDLHIIQVYI